MSFDKMSRLLKKSAIVIELKCVLKMPMPEIYILGNSQYYKHLVKLVRICYDLPQTKKMLVLFGPLDPLKSIAVVGESFSSSQLKRWFAKYPHL